MVLRTWRHHQEFLVFLRHLARGYPDGELHLIMDNYATHKHREVKAWLAANPRIRLHFTPTSGSWLNLVEVWFSIIEKHAIHRGTFHSVNDLMSKVRAFINGRNDRCRLDRRSDSELTETPPLECDED